MSKDKAHGLFAAQARAREVCDLFEEPLILLRRELFDLFSVEVINSYFSSPHFGFITFSKALWKLLLY